MSGSYSGSFSDLRRRSATLSLSGEAHGTRFLGEAFIALDINGQGFLNYRVPAPVTGQNSDAYDADVFVEVSVSNLRQEGPHWVMDFVLTASTWSASHQRPTQSRSGIFLSSTGTVQVDNGLNLNTSAGGGNEAYARSGAADIVITSSWSDVPLATIDMELRADFPVPRSFLSATKTEIHLGESTVLQFSHSNDGLGRLLSGPAIGSILDPSGTYVSAQPIEEGESVYTYSVPGYVSLSWHSTDPFGNFTLVTPNGQEINVSGDLSFGV